MRVSALVSWLVVATATAVCAQQPDPLFRAARSGDLPGVEQALGEGVPIDSVDRYGSTALSMAASNGHIEVVALLLEKGADPDIAESFYYSRPVDSALFFDHIDVAELLISSGAAGREAALSFATNEGLTPLARTVVDSGPIYQSDLAELRARSDLSPEIVAILADAKSRPDPEPPVYTLEELHAHTGVFEGWDSSTRVEVNLREGRLILVLDDGVEHELVATRESRFETPAGDIEIGFFGRAGLIEGFSLARQGADPERLRRSVAEPVATASLERAHKASRPTSEPVVNWPSFRGANAAGIGDGVDTPQRWNLDTEESILWRTEIAGLGNSSPIVWNDRVYLTTAIAEGAEQTIRTGLTGSGESVGEAVPHQWIVLAFDKNTGDEVWRTEVASGVPLTQRHFKATQANSTPATDGRYIVAVFPTAGLACLEMDGKVLWKHELGGLNAGAFSNPSIQWGYASSPIILDDMAILQVDIHEGAYLAAWSLATGEQLWRVERDVAPSWATPTVLRAESGTELIVNGSTIFGYDPFSGQELWSLGPNSELVIATPVVGEGVAYVSAGYPPVKPIYAVRAGTRGNFEVDPGATHERLLWSQQRGGAYMPSPLLYDDMLFVVHHNGRLVVYDAATGNPIHKSRFSQGGVFTASPIAVNEKLYAPTEEGLIYVLEANPSFEELSVNEMDEPVMATPAVSEGILFVRTPSHLTAVADRSN